MNTKMQKWAFIAILQASIVCCAEPTVVELTPPVLNSRSLLLELTYTRPVREGGCHIAKELFSGSQGDKTIVHCYGHGGVGWTTLFGSVNQAISLLEDKKAPIRVIGSGCMGLTAAIELAHRGYKIAGITTKEMYNIPSWRAGGLFSIESILSSCDEHDAIEALCVETFKTYQMIERGEHPYIYSDAVRFLPVYCSSNTDLGLEHLEVLGLIPPREEVTLDFGHGVVHPGYYKFMSFFMDTTQLMRQLTKEVKRLRIPIQMDDLQSFDEVREEIIFNCSGMGAQELNQDSQLMGVRGHLTLLNELAGTEHMDYMIYTKVIQDEKEEYLYMLPKSVSVTACDPNGVDCRGALGGTFIPSVDELSPGELEELDQREFKRLIERHSQFFQATPLPR